MGWPDPRDYREEEERKRTERERQQQMLREVDEARRQRELARDRAEQQR